MLQEQLDQASSANQALREDIRKVTSDWSRSRKELEQREAAWRREEEVGTGFWEARGAWWVQPEPRGRVFVEWRGLGLREKEREALLAT